MLRYLKQTTEHDRVGVDWRRAEPQAHLSRLSHQAHETNATDAISKLVDLRHGIHEFGKILAVTRGMIERVQARIHCRFRQRNAE